MNFLQSSPQERLRPLVGIKGWDFCVFWKLGEDHRCLEWMGCCCCGAEFSVDPFSNLNNTGSSILSCRDVLFPHPRTKTCDIISELPISIQLDSGIHAEAFLSSQPKWITFSDSTEESYKTRVLIPSLCGGWLVELFVSKHVSEDPQLIEFVSAQCNNDFCSGELQQQPLLLVRNHTLHNFNFSPAQQEFPASPNINDCLERDSSTNFENSSLHRQEIISSSPPPIPNNNNLNHFNPWVSQTDNFLGQQFPALNKHDIFFEGSTDSVISDKPSLNIIDHGFQEIVALQQSLGESPHTSGGGNLPKELANDKDMIKQEMSRAESMSDCSDQMENDDDQKTVGRSGRKPQSKNLVAERRRRKKLNERLYALRALVPKITKMDRASILGDAIEYVTELQQQVKQFQDELEENQDEEGENQVTPLVKPNGDGHQNNNNDHEEYPNGLKIGIDQGARCSSSTKPSELLKQNKESDSTDDKAQHMEDQVEVNQGDGNEFNLKIFCERKEGGFVRLMQAMDFLGLEIIHVNITTYSCLVLNVFKAMIRDNEAIQPEQVRDSLLELTKNPNSWSEAKREGGSSSANHHHNNYVHHLHHLNHH